MRERYTKGTLDARMTITLESVTKRQLETLAREKGVKAPFLAGQVLKRFVTQEFTKKNR